MGSRAWFMAALLGASMLSRAGAQQPAPDPLAARVDPYVDKPRVVVMTDIANEPDDQMSMVRFLVYSNQFDVEGLVATTSTWMKNKVRPDVIHTLIDAYEQVLPNLLRHQPGFPSAEALRAVVVSGQPAYGMAAVGPDKMSRRRRPDHPSGGQARRAAALGRSRGAGRTRWPRRCCRRSDEDAGRARRARRRSCASTRSPIRTMRGRGFGASFRRCTTSRCRRRPTAISTPTRRGPASAAIASTRTRLAPTSRRSPTPG